MLGLIRRTMTARCRILRKRYVDIQAELLGWGEATKRRLMTLPRLLTLGVLCVTIPGVTNFVNDAADGPKGYSSVIETDHPVQDMTDDAKRIVKIAFPPAGIIP